MEACRVAETHPQKDRIVKIGAWVHQSQHDWLREEAHRRGRGTTQSQVLREALAKAISCADGQAPEGAQP
jgi:hypothetical protein